VIYPTFIAPLFNKFQPLEDETLKERVNALMQRCGFAAKGLFVMDGSKRSAHANAYFTGFGAAKRVVFFDTLLAKLSRQAEVDAVLAHELGHFKHKHIIQRIVSLFASAWPALRCWAGCPRRPGSTPAWACGPTWTRPTTRWRCCCSCWRCRCSAFSSRPCCAAVAQARVEADAYAVAQTSGQDLSTALLKLYEDNASTLTPDPVFVKFYYSHPPASERLARMTA
jgi:STE24 endopeptidase